MANTITPKTRADMDSVADEMAAGCPSISECARRAGFTQSRADQLWQRIKRELGKQAV